MPRMNILNAEERNAFDCPPSLSSMDRKRVFARSAKVDSVLRTLRTPTNEIYFLLMLGYFKATRRFFLRTQFNEADVNYVARSLGYFEFLAPATELDEATYRRYRKMVLDHLGFGNNQAFAQGEKSEQEIAETCRRLIKNAIICWNYLYASKRLFEETDKEHRQELLTAIRGGSMVAWRHINLHGQYDFSDESLRDSVGLDVPKIQRLEIN